MMKRNDLVWGLLFVFLGSLLLSLGLTVLDDEQPSTQATFVLTNNADVDLEVCVLDTHAWKLSNGRVGRTYMNVSADETVKVDVECYKDYGKWSRYLVYWTTDDWQSTSKHLMHPRPGERIEIHMLA